MSGKSVFATLSSVSMADVQQKKGKFTYLSWPHAIEFLLARYPEATWEIHTTEKGLPFWETRSGSFVKTSVTVGGITRTHIHPVLNPRNPNEPILEPNAFQINTAVLRCLVKTIAMHGLGLYIYQGEDLPPGSGDALPPQSTSKASDASKCPDCGKPMSTKVEKDNQDVLYVRCIECNFNRDATPDEIKGQEKMRKETR